MFSCKRSQSATHRRFSTAHPTFCVITSTFFSSEFPLSGWSFTCWNRLFYFVKVKLRTPHFLHICDEQRTGMNWFALSAYTFNHPNWSTPLANRGRTFFLHAREGNTEGPCALPYSLMSLCADLEMHLKAFITPATAPCDLDSRALMRRTRARKRMVASANRGRTFRVH